MLGRRVATTGEARAARFIAARFREAGLEAGGDSGYFQRLTLVNTTTRTRSASGQDRVRTGVTARGWSGILVESRDMLTSDI